jgi:transcriptional antiterminator RfaH
MLSWVSWCSHPRKPAVAIKGCDGLGLIGSRWYCIRSKYKAEEEARENIAAQGFEVYLPMVIERGRGGVRREHSLFSRYLFALFDVENDYWQRIVSTRGVERLLYASSEDPLPVPVGVVEALVEAGPLDLCGPDPMEPVPVGARVRVLSGLFAGRSGVCVRSSRQRVEVLMRWMRGERIVGLGRSVVIPIVATA